jgi:hypothetical protein
MVRQTPFFSLVDLDLTARSDIISKATALNMQFFFLGVDAEFATLSLLDLTTDRIVYQEDGYHYYGKQNRDFILNPNHFYQYEVTIQMQSIEVNWFGVGGGITELQVTAQVVPEPTSIMLFCSGIFVFAGIAGIKASGKK